jgi:membrane-bound lytic murein transglycosylase B
MQFESATWRAYGLGGDVYDEHDAILAAANLLAANGGRLEALSAEALALRGQRTCVCDAALDPGR